MSDKLAFSLGEKSFEDLKKINQYNAEYWCARDLQPLLGYDQWRRFEQAINRAITSCKESGNEPDHHFASAGKMIEVGKGGQRKVEDYHLSTDCQRLSQFLIEATFMICIITFIF